MNRLLILLVFVFSLLIAFDSFDVAYSHDSKGYEPYLLRIGDADADKLLSVLKSNDIITGDFVDGALQIKTTPKTAMLLEQMGAKVEPTFDWSYLPPDVDPSLFADPDEINSLFMDLSQRYPNIVSYQVLGQSLEDRSIFGIRLHTGTAVPQTEFRILGCHHGNELMSAEVVFRIAKYFAENHDSDTEVSNILQRASVLFVPVVNPDGRWAFVRENARGIDLNRNYGYHWILQETGGEHAFSEPEVQAIALDHFRHHYSVSLSFHTYGDIVNYVWNYSPNPTPDESSLYLLSNLYSSFTGYSVIRGYQWYKTNGDTNDFSYGLSGDFDWTIEVANDGIDDVFAMNLQAVKALFLRQLTSGLKIYVKDEHGNPIADALVRIYDSRTHLPFSWVGHTNEAGIFSRMISGVNGYAKIWANGFVPKRLGLNLSQHDLDSGVDLDVVLLPDDHLAKGAFAHRLIEVESVDRNPSYPFESLGPADGIGYALDTNGVLVVELADVCASDENEDLAVVALDENDSFAYVGVSEDPFGPFADVKLINGSSVVDVPDDMPEFRYVRIKDVGQSAQGFLLDAIFCMNLAGDDEEIEPESDGDEDLVADSEWFDEEELEPEPEFAPEYSEVDGTDDAAIDDDSAFDFEHDEVVDDEAVARESAEKKVHKKAVSSGCKTGGFVVSWSVFSYWLILVLFYRRKRGMQ